MDEQKRFLTPPCTLSYPKLWHKAPTSSLGKKQAKEQWKYSAAFLFDPDDDKWDEIIEEVTLLKKRVGKKLQHCCLKMHDEHGMDYDGYPGMNVLQARTYGSKKPEILGATKDSAGKWIRLNEDEDSNKVYGGAQARALIHFFDYYEGSVGIACNLHAVQILGDGPVLGGSSVDPDETFDDEVAAEFEAEASSFLS